MWRLTEEEGQQCWELVFFFHSSARCCFPHFEPPLPLSLFLIFSTSLLLWWLPLLYGGSLSETCPVCLPGNSEFCSHPLHIVLWLVASPHGLIISSGEDSLHSPKCWREKGTAVRSNDVAQLDTACSCLEAAGLLLTPDPVPPGPRLQMGQIRSRLTAAH